MAAWVRETRSDERLYTQMLGIFGGLTLAIACLGLYGAQAIEVARRRPEIGLRVALGASRSEVVEGMVRGAWAMALSGVAEGLAVALVLTRFLGLMEVDPRDPWSWVVATAVMTGSVLLASWIPARRAATVAPAEALRAE